MPERVEEQNLMDPSEKQATWDWFTVFVKVSSIITAIVLALMYLFLVA